VPGEEVKNGDMRTLEAGLSFSPFRFPFSVVKKMPLLRFV